MVEGSADCPELALADGFSEVVRAHYKGPVPVADIAGAASAFLVGYLVQFTPAQRAQLLSGIIDAVISGFHENDDADLMLLN